MFFYLADIHSVEEAIELSEEVEIKYNPKASESETTHECYDDLSENWEGSTIHQNSEPGMYEFNFISFRFFLNR